MTSRTTHKLSVVRKVLVTALLALGFITASQAASADVLNPGRDTGGSGGSGGAATVDYPVLDGSGYENQTVAVADSLETAGGTLDEAARSTELINIYIAAQASDESAFTSGLAPR